MQPQFTPQQIDTFWLKVNKDGPIVRPELGPCWLWTTKYGTPPTAYGRTYFPGTTTPINTHRLSWMIANGPIAVGLWVLHKCDNPPCVRPDHLYLGTAKNNIDDAVARGRYVRPQPIGSKSSSAKLTEAVVLEIRTLYAKGMSTRELADRHHVHITTMQRIVSGQSWSHVPMVPVPRRDSYGVLRELVEALRDGHKTPVASKYMHAWAEGWSVGVHQQAADFELFPAVREMQRALASATALLGEGAKA